MAATGKEIAWLLTQAHQRVFVNDRTECRDHALRAPATCIAVKSDAKLGRTVTILELHHHPSSSFWAQQSVDFHRTFVQPLLVAL